MKCPVCKSARLINTKYNDVAVKICVNCAGHMVRRQRISRIKTSRMKSDEELLAEMSLPSAVDTLENLRCPTCRNPMEKSNATLAAVTTTLTNAKSATLPGLIRESWQCCSCIMKKANKARRCCDSRND